MGDPRALVLSSGDQRMSANGRDWNVMGRALDAVGCYHHSMLVELSAMGVASGQWLGYDREEEPAHSAEDLDRPGAWGRLPCALCAIVSDQPGFHTARGRARYFAAALLPLRRGVGRLFGLSSPACDGVFVLVSPDSSIVLRVHGYDTRDHNDADLAGRSREAVHGLLSGMGVAWSTMSPSDLEARGARLHGRATAGAADVRRPVGHGVHTDRHVGKEWIAGSLPT